MNTKALQFLATALVAVAMMSVPLAQSLELRLATVVPDGSVWDAGLRQMAVAVQEDSAERVTVTVFSGGSQGDEPTVLRKMRINALQAASLTVVGLASIDPAFNVFNVPFFLASYDELNSVVDSLSPLLRRRLEDKGFILLNWGHGGWLQVFSKNPIRSIADLKGSRLYTSAGDDRMTQWYKGNGYQPRAMAMTDILTGLTTGMIDALPTTPIAAMAFQWNRQAPYMLDIGLAPIVGATVVSARAWKQMGDVDRAALMKAGAALEAQLQTAVPQQDAFAVALMGAQGLQVTQASGPDWEAEAERLAAGMRGNLVPADVFDLALEARDAYRQRAGTAR